MADDLSAAPSGSSEAAPASSVDAGSAASSAPAKAVETKAPSLRDTLSNAMKVVESRPPNETEKALAVMKAGMGADEKADTDHDAAVADAERTLEEKRAASERAKKGHETRKLNAEKAAEAEKSAETIAKAVGDKVAEAVKPADKAPEKAADTVEAKPVETKFKEPPSRFAPTAKAEWEKVPEAVKAEIDRSHKELEQGIQKYKDSADRWSELDEYVKLSEQYYKQPLKETLKQYAQWDRDLADPNPETSLATLEKIVSGMKYQAADGNTYNWDLPQLAQYILDQSEQGVASFQNPQADLQRKLDDALARLERMESGQSERETQRVQQERERTTKTIESQIETFAKANPRFDELFPDMELILSSPKFPKSGDAIADLKAAYEKAERLNPAPTISPPAPDLPAHDIAAQTRKAQASVTGAPGSGSNPAKKPAPSSARDALKSAFAATGLSHR